jgi:esterase/lipase
MKYKPSETVIVFSHGFGVRKDSRGLFSFLSEMLEEKGFAVKLFDYNKFDEKTKELFAIPFSSQAKLLQKEIDKLVRENKYNNIIILGHSQGSLIPALCNNLTKVVKVIAVSPLFETKFEDLEARYTKLSDNKLDFYNITRRRRSDGSVTVIPPEYWAERFETDVVYLYNKLAKQTELTLIYAINDEVMDFSNLRSIKNTRIINLDGNHDFSNQYRDDLYKTILWDLDLSK